MDIKNWKEQEADKIHKKEEMEKELNYYKNKHAEELKTIKKERDIAIDKLRKEMLTNIRNVKT